MTRKMTAYNKYQGAKIVTYGFSSCSCKDIYMLLKSQNARFIIANKIITMLNTENTTIDQSIILFQATRPIHTQKDKHRNQREK